MKPQIIDGVILESLLKIVRWQVENNLHFYSNLSSKKLWFLIHKKEFSINYLNFERRYTISKDTKKYINTNTTDIDIFYTTMI